MRNDLLALLSERPRVGEGSLLAWGRRQRPPVGAARAERALEELVAEGLATVHTSDTTGARWWSLAGRDASPPPPPTETLEEPPSEPRPARAPRPLPPALYRGLEERPAPPPPPVAPPSRPWQQAPAPPLTTLEAWREEAQGRAPAAATAREESRHQKPAAPPAETSKTPRDHSEDSAIAPEAPPPVKTSPSERPHATVTAPPAPAPSAPLEETATSSQPPPANDGPEVTTPLALAQQQIEQLIGGLSGRERAAVGRALVTLGRILEGAPEAGVEGSDPTPAGLSPVLATVWRTLSPAEAKMPKQIARESGITGNSISSALRYLESRGLAVSPCYGWWKRTG